MTQHIFGPFKGYYVAVHIRAEAGPTGKLVAEYEIYPRVPKDIATQDALLKKRVEGLSNTVADAKQIAVQLARLQIANLPSRDSCSGSGSEPELPIRTAPPFYPATIPCPLLPVAGTGDRR